MKIQRYIIFIHKIIIIDITNLKKLLIKLKEIVSQHFLKKRFDTNLYSIHNQKIHSNNNFSCEIIL